MAGGKTMNAAGGMGERKHGGRGRESEDHPRKGLRCGIPKDSPLLTNIFFFRYMEYLVRF